MRRRRVARRRVVGDARRCFRGRNRAGIFRWGRIREVVVADPYELVWRTVPTPLYPDSTEWTIRLRPTGDGAEIVQTFTVLRGAKLLATLYGLIIPAHRDRTVASTQDLRRIGDLVHRPRRRTAPLARGPVSVSARNVHSCSSRLRAELRARRPVRSDSQRTGPTPPG